MNEMIQLLTGFAGGILLGLFFYWGLKFTMKKGLKSKNPALWFVLSFLIRTGIVVASFYFLAGGNWKTLLAMLAGFTISRFAFTGSRVSTAPGKTD